MSNFKLENPWQELLNLFNLSDSLTEKTLIKRIKDINLSNELSHALISSIEGNNRIINQYLFDLPVNYKQPVAWIAPVVINGDKRYAWMIGQVSSEIAEVRSKFDQASSKVGNDSILMCKKESKPLMFIEPYAVSNFDDSQVYDNFESAKISDDFAIFQVGYKEGDIDDFDQQIILNATLLEKNFKSAIANATQVINELQETDKLLLEQKAKLFAMLHAEAHNRGHFAGAWPFDKNKNSLLYEAVEEFRACLNAIKWAEHLKLNDDEADLFTFGVFAVRFFHYGYRAYIDPVKNHQSIRETSVALMFFEILYQANVFNIDHGKNILKNFDLTKLRPALINVINQLNQQEFKEKNQGIEGLREIGRHWYKIAYPNSNISPEAQAIYNHLRNLSTV